MSGLLSQAVANLTAATQQVSNLSGLPVEARHLQAATAGAITPLITQIRAMQLAGAGFVQTALPELNAIETLITNEQPLVSIKAEMARVLGRANVLDASVNQVTAQINSVSTLVFGDFNQLATIEAGLTTQMTTLHAQLGDAQGQEDAAKTRYYYLIALGPFGLVGLAVAFGLYMKWRSDVNGYESQISSLNGQINSLTAMRSACQLMGTDLQGVIAKASGIRNSVGSLTGSIQGINTDLSLGSSYIVLCVLVRAAITEVTTLGVDMS